MDHRDHIKLLQDGVPNSGGIWADLGAGSGAFTLALAELLNSNGKIIAVDKDARSLKRNQDLITSRFPNTNVLFINADFTKPIELPEIDGVVMANSLHFQRDKESTLGRITDYLRSGGRLILIEYDSDRGNVWVPHPISFRSWKALAVDLGYVEPMLLAKHPGRFMGGIYSALTFVP